ncbi:unnamed protein product [Diatraea saccharalis]|uniref:Uncharacterized protein n=1 Tax=Diatraea saccharalis TaxID=40085 RepID=A0A9N9R688_9NEOP|nr:unnamed protein product [Diatraea saccharalis]
MASSRGARKRTRGGASGASVTSEASDAKRCPPRFTGGARSQLTLASITRAGYDDELEKDSVLLQAAKNYYPEGNCYTPATKSMRLINMPPKRRPPPKLYGPLGDNGELQFPPPKSWQERERESASLCSPVLACASLCSHVLACARLCLPVLACARLCWPVLSYPILCYPILSYTRPAPSLSATHYSKSVVRIIRDARLAPLASVPRDKELRYKNLARNYCLVYIEDLVSGAYDIKEKAEAEAKRKRIEKRRKEKEAAEIAAKEALKK